jgi:lysophospholipid acyltransferase (LPLAT)-like uncharacterized protein
VNERLQYILADYIAPWIVRGLAKTLRLRRVDFANLEKARDENGHVLYGCLHGRMFMPVLFYYGEGATTLVSQSRDGELVARLVHKLGHHTVRGSSHRGGREGLRSMIEAGKRGDIAMMVDGPRGPHEDPKMGTIALARLSGMAIIPTVGSASASWQFGSWDKFQLPKPFTRCFLMYGEPLHVPKSAKGEEAMEEYRLELKRRLIALRERSDRIASGEEAA